MDEQQYIEQLRQWLETRLEAVAPGRYEYREFLASGGLGAVYRYHDRSSLDIDVAIKAIDPERLGTVPADQQVMILRRFTNEARVDAYLRKRGVHVHPVVYIHDAQGVPAFMVTDLLHGPTFEQRMQTLRTPGQPMEIDKIIGTLAALAPSLAAIHRVGVIHRDLKPTNVMLIPDDTDPAGCRAILIDFGMAHVPEGGIWKTVATRPGELWITQTYASPEKLRGEAIITDADDMYAFGVMAYRAFSGILPFEDQVRLEAEAQTSDSAIITRACQWRAYKQEPTDLRALNSKVPAALSQLIMHMLAVNPSERPSGSQVTAELIKMLPKPNSQQEGADATMTLQSVGRRAPLNAAAQPKVVQKKKKLSPALLVVALLLLLGGTVAMAAMFVLPKFMNKPNPKAVADNPLPPTPKGPPKGKAPMDLPKSVVVPVTNLELVSEFKKGHTAAVTSVALSRDGKYLASSGEDGLFCLWQIEGATLLDTKSSPVAEGIEFNPEGTMIATRGQAGYRMWKIEEGKLVRGLRIGGPVVFGRDGKQFFESPEDGVVVIREVGDGTVIKTVNTELIGALSLFASRTEDKIGILGYDDVPNLACRLMDNEGNMDPPVALELDYREVENDEEEACITLRGMSADLQHVYMDTCDSKLEVLSVRNGSKVIIGKEGDPVAWCVGHPQQPWVALASRPSTLPGAAPAGTLTIWDLREGKERAVVNKGSKLVTALSFSDDGRLLAAAEDDPNPRLFRIAE